MFSTDRNIKFFSLSIQIQVTEAILSSPERCILSYGDFKLSHIGRPEGAPRFRFTARDADDDRIFDIDFQYEMSPGHRHQIILSFSSKDWILFAIDRSYLSVIERNVPEGLNFDLNRKSKVQCLACSGVYSAMSRTMDVEMSVVFMSNEQAISPIDLWEHPYKQYVNRIAPKAPPEKVGVLLTSRSRQEYIPVQRTYLALQAICTHARSVNLGEILVDHTAATAAPTHLPGCGSSNIRYISPVSSLSWAQKVLRGLHYMNEETEYVVIADVDVMFTPSTLSGLLSKLVKNPRAIVGSIIVDANWKVHVAGYQLAWTAISGADYVVPVQKFQGYPLASLGDRGTSFASLLSGHVFAGDKNLLALALASHRAAFKTYQSAVLSDVDFFLHLHNNGIYLSLVQESVAISILTQNDNFLSHPENNADAVSRLNATWGNVLLKMLQNPLKLSIGVRWLMHCAGSMGGEAMTMIAALENQMSIRTQVTRPVPYCEHNDENIKSAPRGMKHMYDRLRQLDAHADPEIFVYHRDYRALGEHLRGIQSRYTIGRYMFEGNGTIHAKQLSQLRALDEIWVPSRFHRSVLEHNGISAAKVTVIPEAIDVQLLRSTAEAHYPLHIPGTDRRTFKFLSVFKLEDRKGWQQLVEAYCRAFSFGDSVVLILHTHIYGSADPWNAAKITELVNNALNSARCKTRNTRPKLYITGRPLSFIELVRLYKTADVYVSAHWGEGWGMPMSEAMSLGIPTIATDFSGNTEFMTNKNSFLVPAAEYVAYDVTDEWFGGLHHAIINVNELSITMKNVFVFPDAARARGALGAKSMSTYFNPDAVAERIMDRLKTIETGVKDHAPKSTEKLRSNPGFLDSHVMQACSEKHTNQSPAPREYLKKILLVSTFLPRRCGIAVFAQNLLNGFQALRVDLIVEVIAVTKDLDHYNYPREVTRYIREGIVQDYVDAAKYINSGRFDAVFLQHEFGIFAPFPDGGLVTCLTSRVRVPLYVTFHTVLPRLTDHEGSILQLLSTHAQKVVVMTGMSRKMLENVFFINASKIVTIPHGVPGPSTISSRKKLREKLGWEDKIVILSTGLLRRGKGYEHVLHALPAVLHQFPNFVFALYSKPHPTEQDSAKYLAELTALTKQLQIQDSVDFSQTFLSYDEITPLLGAADIFVAPYTDESVSSSGTVSMAMAAGTPCVATPFLFAREMLTNERGVLVTFNDHRSLSHAFMRLADRELRKRIGANAKSAVSQSTWTNVAAAYLSMR